MATTIAEPTVENIRSRSQELGVEFYFAQFVDMYARPSAKLVPAAYLDDLVSDGAGFAGFAAGEIGQAGGRVEQQVEAGMGLLEAIEPRHQPGRGEGRNDADGQASAVPAGQN